MKFRFTLIVLFFMALLFIIASSYTWAQNLPKVPGTDNDIWASPQSRTTEGRYRSNADDFIRPDTHTSVRFDKWFGMAAFMYWGNYNYNPLATLGFATKANDLYIGAFYSGDFWTAAPANNRTEQVPNAVPAGGIAGKRYNVYNNINISPYNVNNVAVLLGFADMGVRITYRTNFQIFSEKDIVFQNQLYKSYHTENGYIAPQIAWAFSKDLISGKGVRPYAAIDLVFDRSYLKTETNGDDNAGNSGEKIGRSANVFSPALSLGLGSYHFYNQDGFRGSFDVDYTFNLKIYDNEYSYVENGKYKTGKFNGTYDNPATINYMGRSYFTNTLTPSVAGSWSKERLALRFKLNLPLTLSVEEASAMMLDDSNLVKGNGNSDKTTTFTFRPDVRLAMQYKIIPDKLNLNVGARIQASAMDLVTIERNYYNNKGERVIPLSQKIYQNDYNPQGRSIASRFHIGPTFYLTENFWVEATTGVSNAFGENAIEVFAEGGLFSFGSILVCLKF